MILVTGAGGKTGQALIRALRARGAMVRALMHRPAPVEADETAAGDMRDPAVLRPAMRQVRAVYHICPNMSPDETAIGRAVVEAARQAGVERVVYHSVLHPQVEAMPHHWAKMRVEAALFESGLDFTLLQPTAYMQNLLPYWERIVSDGRLALPYPPATRLSLVDLEDVAQAAARVLTEAGHGGATYELAGTGPLSQDDVAAALARHLGRPVRAMEIPLEDWERQARASGLPAYNLNTLRAMFQYYARHGMWSSPRVLGWLLGRAPAGLDDFVQRTHAGQAGS